MESQSYLLPDGRVVIIAQDPWGVAVTVIAVGSDSEMHEWYQSLISEAVASWDSIE